LRVKTRWNSALIFAAFLIAVAVVHSPFINNPFLHDDIASIVDNPYLGRLDSIPKFFAYPFMFPDFYATDLYRPFLLTTYAVNYAISGLNPWSWRLFNLALLALNALLVVRFLEDVGLDGRRSVIGGAFLLLHPISGYCFRLVSARSVLLMFLFILLGVMSHRRAFKKERPLYPFAVLAVVCMALGLLSVSAAIIFPAIIMLVEGGKLGKHPFAAIKRVAPYVVLAAAYLVFRKFFLGRTFGGNPVRPLLVNLGIQAKAWWLYIGESLYPVRMNIYPVIQVPGGDGNIFLVLAATGIFLWLVLGCKWWLSGRSSTRGILLLWGPMIYLPYAIIPLNVPLAYHHFYPSLAALAGLAAIGSGRAGKRAVALAAIIIACLAALNVHHDLRWRNRFQWAAGIVRASPESGRAWNALGLAYYSNEKYGHAVAAYDRALRGDERLLDVYHNLAAAFFRAERYDDALRALRYYKEHSPKARSSARVEGEIGMALVRAGRFGEAIPYLERAMEKLPNDPGLLTHKAMALAGMGKTGEAKNLYLWILNNYPGYPEALKGYIRLALSTGDITTALKMSETAEKAYGFAPDLAHLHAAAYVRYGLPEEALKILEKAREEHPAEVSLWLHAGNILGNIGKKEEALELYRRALKEDFPTERKNRIRRILESLEDKQREATP